MSTKPLRRKQINEEDFMVSSANLPDIGMMQQVADILVSFRDTFELSDIRNYRLIDKKIESKKLL